MPRFRLNRSWGFVLTLCLLTTCFYLTTAQLPSVASADSGSCYMPDQDRPTDPSLGDPDVPMGPGDGKTSNHVVIRGGSVQVTSQDRVRPVGDGAVLNSVSMNRIHLFLLGLRSLFLRF
jgi:hypothetical protein